MNLGSLTLPPESLAVDHCWWAGQPPMQIAKPMRCARQLTVSARASR